MLNERFWSKVAVRTDKDCWEWQANKNNKGYGMFSINSYVGKKLAHRLSYENSFGKIPDGMHILHSCDNPACVNPSHLSAGTRSDNMTDCASKGRTGNMALADVSVICLLKDYIEGMSHADIASKYGISVKTVPDFVTGDSRKWLHGKHGCPSTEEIRNAKNLKPNATLTAETVLEIRKKLKSGMMGKDIAIEYGVHSATVSDIKLRKIWKDI